MSEKPAAEASPASAPATGKSGVVGKIILVVVTLLLVVGAAVAGAMFGPQLLGRGQPAGAAAGKQAEHGGEGKQEEAEEEPESSGKKEVLPEIQSLEGLVVDIRAATGELHHLKVAIAVEVKGELQEEDFKKLIPRGRDAAIEYLRSLDYDDVTSPAHYQAIRQELNARITKAMGKKNVKRILFTDFVVQ